MRKHFPSLRNVVTFQKKCTTGSFQSLEPRKPTLVEQGKKDITEAGISSFSVRIQWQALSPLTLVWEASPLESALLTVAALKLLRNSA